MSSARRKLKNAHLIPCAFAIALAAMLFVPGCTNAASSESGSSTTARVTAEAEPDYDWDELLANPDEWFGSDEARAIADSCVQHQVEGEGGWQKGMEETHENDWAHSTLDNNATTSQIRFLMRTYDQTGERAYLESAMRGIDCLFEMQYEHGGWMQSLNVEGTYHAHVTLNDNAFLNALMLMRDISTGQGCFSQIDEAYRQKAALSFDKGLQCLLELQMPGAIWCQQYDEATLEPTTGRSYELPALCTRESEDIVQFLHEYGKEHPDRADVRASVNTALAWFDKSAIENASWVEVDGIMTLAEDDGSTVWARFYELDTERPVFFTRDSSIHYDVEELPAEDRNRYEWYGDWGNAISALAPLGE